MKDITEKQIEEILFGINNRRTLEAKKILRELPDCVGKEKVEDKIKGLIRNTGRSNMVSLDEVKRLLED